MPLKEHVNIYLPLYWCRWYEWCFFFCFFFAEYKTIGTKIYKPKGRLCIRLHYNINNYIQTAQNPFQFISIQIEKVHERIKNSTPFLSFHIFNTLISTVIDSFSLIFLQLIHNFGSISFMCTPTMHNKRVNVLHQRANSVIYCQFSN